MTNYKLISFLKHNVPDHQVEPSDRAIFLPQLTQPSFYQ